MWASLEFEFSVYLLFFLISTIYSSVGFGGGSSYLAILAIYGFPPQLMRLSALSCNIAVVGSNISHNLRAIKNEFKKIFSIVLPSIPFAYLGGMIQLKQEVYLSILGIILLIIGLKMLFLKRITYTIQLPIVILILIGVFIGFLSGMIGIGGGIFLAPILYLTRWGTEKLIAICASVYIFFNSAASILGQLSSSLYDIDFISLLLLIITVITGSMIGNYLLKYKFRLHHIRKITAILIIFVSLRILYHIIIK